MKYFLIAGFVCISCVCLLNFILAFLTPLKEKCRHAIALSLFGIIMYFLVLIGLVTLIDSGIAKKDIPLSDFRNWWKLCMEYCSEIVDIVKQTFRGGMKFIDAVPQALIFICAPVVVFVLGIVFGCADILKPNNPWSFTIKLLMTIGSLIGSVIVEFLILFILAIVYGIYYIISGDSSIGGVLLTIICILSIGAPIGGVVVIITD